MFAVRQLRYVSRLYSPGEELAFKMASNSEVKDEDAHTKKKKPPMAKTRREEDYYYKGLTRLAKQYGPVYRIDLGVM